MKLKDKLYCILVERNADIKAIYQDRIISNPEHHKRHRLQSWLFLLSLNFQHYICGRTPSTANIRKSTNQLKYPETAQTQRLSVDDFIELLSPYDVISFDVFDTLLFRAVSDPTDLFILVGNRLKIMNFKNIRIDAEKEARNKSKKPFREIDIEDIYDVIQLRCGVDKNLALKAEIQAEMDLCFANPYMLEVYDRLAKKGKQVIAVSNMYLHKGTIIKLLNKSGYNIQQIFISCDYLCSKHRGILQNKVSTILGTNRSYIHVGDNYTADFVGSRMAGWKSFYYKGVNEIGRAYRPARMSKLGGSLYSGLVNAKLHNGYKEVTPYYEFGYAYGGILACGYCSWLNHFAAEHDLDKLLFSGRDMYVIHEIYNKYYKKLNNDYILLSRYAAQRFSFERFSEYFIGAHIFSRARTGKLSIGEAFDELGFNILVPHLEKYNLRESDPLSVDIYEQIKAFIYNCKDLLITEFSEEQRAAIQYYMQFTQGCKNVGIVDLGWQGTNALCLKYLLEECSGQDINIFSLLMCATGGDFVDHFLSCGITSAFSFSHQLNPDMQYHFRTATTIGRFPCELLFTSPEASLKTFHVDTKGRVEPVFMPKEERNPQLLEDIFNGIRDFAYDYNQLGVRANDFEFSGFESILPLNKLLYNKNYIIKLLSDFENTPWLGVVKNKNVSKIENIIK